MPTAGNKIQYSILKYDPRACGKTISKTLAVLQQAVSIYRKKVEFMYLISTDREK